MSHNWLDGKSVLITGVSGTVGSALLKEVLRANIKVVRALDYHEHGMFQLQQQLGQRENVRWLLGDIRDERRLRRAMENIDVVFHAAALKHVTIGEYNPFEIVQTNLVGLQNVIQAALENDVERMIFTSSDKAVNPTNTMGASKLMGERLVAAANEMRGTAGTRFASVRFGNVLGSNGSVADIFRRQIAAGGPVTLTDRRMTRFVMGLENSVRLVLRAADWAVGGEVFVLKMFALSIIDLAEVMIRKLAPQHGYLPQDIQIVEIGSQTGEKLYEELLTEAEIPRSFEDDELIVYLGERAESKTTIERSYLKTMRPVSELCHSAHRPLLNKDEVEAYLEQVGLLEKINCTEVTA
jgi:FlaA1/EpsC-like NDP-sugar epimerase